MTVKAPLSFEKMEDLSFQCSREMNKPFKGVEDFNSWLKKKFNVTYEYVGNNTRFIHAEDPKDLTIFFLTAFE